VNNLIANRETQGKHFVMIDSTEQRKMNAVCEQRCCRRGCAWDVPLSCDPVLMWQRKVPDMPDTINGNQVDSVPDKREPDKMPDVIRAPSTRLGSEQV
jgi:hypothetical protein